VKRQFELRSPADRFDPPTHYLPRHAFGGHLVPGEGATGLRMDGRGVLRRRRRGGRRRTARSAGGQRAELRRRSCPFDSRWRVGV